MNRLFEKISVAMMMVAMLVPTSCKDDNQEIVPAEKISEVHYTIVSAEQGREYFSTEPLHQQVTPLFVSLIMEQNNISYQQWVDFSNTCILDGKPEDKALLARVELEHNARLRELGISIPGLDNVQYVNMTMKNFQDMTAFTSATRVYANMDELTSFDENLVGHVTWHELWHVISRNNPALRKQMYALIGFHVMDKEVDMPAEVKAHILCNPDVERHDSYATFTIDGKKTDCMLLLYAPEDRFEEGMSFVDYVTTPKGYWLLALDSETHQPYKVDGKYAVYNCTEASDFAEVMSAGNTSYCDDPEECMADNFAFAMMNKTDLPNQKLLADIRALLQSYKF